MRASPSFRLLSSFTETLIFLSLFKNHAAPRHEEAGKLFLINLIKGSAIGEMGFKSILPSAKCVIDLEQFDLWEFVGIFCGNPGIGWAIKILRCNLLAFFRIKILQIGFSNRSRAFLVHHLVHYRNRRLSENAESGDHDFELSWGPIP